MKLASYIILCFGFIFSSTHSFSIDGIGDNKSAQGKISTAKIAVVDIQAILEHSLAMKSIRKSMNVISASLQENLSNSEQELKDIEKELIISKGHLTEKEFDSQTETFNKKVARAQLEVQEKKQKLDQAHADAVLKVNEFIMKIIQEVSIRKDIGIVFPSSQTLFVSERFNITDTVIRLLNLRLKYVKINFEY